MNNRIKVVSPMIKIAACFLFVIIVGFLLLKLPFSVKAGYELSWIDAIFTSTSAVCVTGLTVIPNVGITLSVFGKIVLALLIQIGGLGFVTVVVFIMTLLGVKIGINDRFLIKEALNQNTSAGLIRLAKTIILITIIIEGLGFLVNMIVFTKDYEFFEACGISAFHSISSFNNAGFDIFGYDSSMAIYSDNILLNLNTSMLIILGGLGFIVIYDVYKNHSWKKISIHSKIVIKITLTLVITGTILLKVSEGILNKEFSWLEAFFQSVTARTAGFCSVDMRSLNGLSLLIMIILMFIGASPSSTGGGVKTTTFYTIIKTIVSFSRGKPTLTYKKLINDETKVRAFMLVTLALGSIVVGSCLLLFIEKDSLLFDATITNIVFETTSAFATVGLTAGVTTSLTGVSKIILCFLMFLGRLGPLTIFSLWNKKWYMPVEGHVEYLEEKLIIG